MHSYLEILREPRFLHHFAPP